MCDFDAKTRILLNFYHILITRNTASFSYWNSSSEERSKVFSGSFPFLASVLREDCRCFCFV